MTRMGLGIGFSSKEVKMVGLGAVPGKATGCGDGHRVARTSDVNVVLGT